MACDEGSHVWWDEGKIMKIINLKRQPKISRFYHWYCLQSHMKGDEKESLSIHLIALSPNISSLEDETKSSLFLIRN